MGLTPGPIPGHRLGQQHAARRWRRSPQPTRIPQSGAAGFVQQHSDGGARRRGGDRHPGHLHDVAGGARDGLGPQGDPPRRRQPVVQPVRHQGRRRAGRARWPRSRPPNTSTASAQKVTAKFRAYDSYAESFADYAQADEGQPALRRRWWTQTPPARQALRPGPAARRLRHRPGLRRQAEPGHQHDLSNELNE